MTIYYEGGRVVRDDGLVEPTWVFHPRSGRRLVSAGEARSLYGEGWYPSPDFGAFPEPKPSAKEPPAARPPNLATMSKASLVTFAKTRLGLELVPDSMTKAAMIERIEAAVAALEVTTT